MLSTCLDANKSGIDRGDGGLEAPTLMGMVAQVAMEHWSPELGRKTSMTCPDCKLTAGHLRPICLGFQIKELGASEMAHTQQIKMLDVQV